MSDLSILFHPAPVLSEKAQELELVDYQFLKELLDKTKKDKVFGIAAPQVGVSQRVFAALIEGEYKLFVNPHILKSSEVIDVASEMCLSLPGVSVLVERPIDLLVSYHAVDLENKSLVRQERKLFKMDARVFMHEYDHLDGVTLLSKMGPVKKGLYEKKVLKYTKQLRQMSQR